MFVTDDFYLGRTTEYYHYFCCLFSTDGVQAGKDEEGLNGFLLKDLKLELKRGASLKCDFCNKAYDTGMYRLQQ